MVSYATCFFEHEQSLVLHTTLSSTMHCFYNNSILGMILIKVLQLGTKLFLLLWFQTPYQPHLSFLSNNKKIVAIFPFNHSQRTGCLETIPAVGGTLISVSYIFRNYAQSKLFMSKILSTLFAYFRLTSSLSRLLQIFTTDN